MKLRWSIYLLLLFVFPAPCTFTMENEPGNLVDLSQIVIGCINLLPLIETIEKEQLHFEEQFEIKNKNDIKKIQELKQSKEKNTKWGKPKLTIKRKLFTTDKKISLPFSGINLLKLLRTHLIRHIMIKQKKCITIPKEWRLGEKEKEKLLNDGIDKKELEELLEVTQVSTQSKQEKISPIRYWIVEEKNKLNPLTYNALVNVLNLFRPKNTISYFTETINKKTKKPISRWIKSLSKEDDALVLTCLNKLRNEWIELPVEKITGRLQKLEFIDFGYPIKACLFFHKKQKLITLLHGLILPSLNTKIPKKDLDLAEERLLKLKVQNHLPELKNLNPSQSVLFIKK